jgi:hypothetical protein
MLNLSTTGMLVSSGRPYSPGYPVTIRLWGPDADLTIAARVVRSRAQGGASGISYQVAAGFREPLLRVPPVPGHVPLSRSACRHLVEIMTVVNDASRKLRNTTRSRVLEEALHRAVSALDIRILDAPSPVAAGGDAIYFSVPTDGSPQPILQVTFARGHAPRREDFEVLEAAAVLAADVLEMDAGHLARGALR